MKHPQRNLTLVLASVIWATFACSRPGSDSKENAAYIASVKEWHNNRIERLRKPDGWLSLAGLFWLEPGPNRFGSGSGNDIVFPAGKGPERIGTLTLAGAKILLEVEDGVEVEAGGRAIRRMQLQSDAGDEPTILTLGPLSWYIIKRGERFGVRLRDRDNPVRLRFSGIDMYPIDPKWRVAAHLEASETPRKIKVPTVLGTIAEEICPGALVFDIDGETYRLDPVLEEGDDELFVIFGDKTNGSETYGGGRFVYVALPDSTGRTVLDFSRAYNPPCAFTGFATCPLPPAQNKLPIRIEAGEKRYAGLAAKPHTAAAVGAGK